MQTKFIYSWLVVVLVALGTFVSACQQLPGTKQEQGAVLGGAVGAVAGQQIGDGALGTLIGAVAGGVAGSIIGERMEEQDRQRTAQALTENETVAWTNPETDTTYRVNPTETFERNGQLCREYVMTARIDGEPREVQGVACRQPNGAWQTVS